MRKVLVAVVGTAGLVLGLSACGASTPPAGDHSPTGPATHQAEQRDQGQAGQPGQGQVGSPEQELARIGSTLDAIDDELAGDGSP